MLIETMISELSSPVDKNTSMVLIKSSELSGRQLVPLKRTGKPAEPIGVTELLVADEKLSQFFPVVDGFPMLMAPEMLVDLEELDNYPIVDLNDPRYAEAYEEMGVYNGMCEGMVKRAEQGDLKDILGPMGALEQGKNVHGDTFPRPENIWVDAKHDSISQLEAYDYLSPLTNQTFLQLGGSGSHAVKALLAGATKVFLITPMVGEAKVAKFLASYFGVSDGLGCVIAVGEELPFKNESLDLIYSGGCFHHMRLDFTAKELLRVLCDGGKFSGVDPWKTPLHTIGTSIIGKREKSVFCKPITKERLQPILDNFSDAKIRLHGPLLRYFFLALEKLGLQLSTSKMLAIARFDDVLGKKLRLSKFGGSIMLAGTK